MFNIRKNKIESPLYEQDIGTFIKSVRISRDLTQKELADILNVSVKSISRWENNNGFPDPLVQLQLCQTLGITLEELHTAKINNKQRNKEKKETIIKRILVSLIFLLTLCFIIIHIRFSQFKNNYNPLSLYYVDVTNENQTQCNIDGYYITNRNINLLYIGNIKLLIDDINETDLIEINFIYNNEIIFTANDNKNISIKLDKDINPKDIKVEIKITDYKTNKEKLNNTFRIDLTPAMTESTLDYEENNDNIIINLLDMGFEKSDSDTYIKKNKDEEAIYNSMNAVLEIHTNGNNKFTIQYYFDINKVKISLSSKISDHFVMTEKYTYNIKTKEIINEVGHGYSLKNALEILSKYITLKI